MKLYSDAIEMMREMGGSFVQSLAHCHNHADAENRRRLRDAFPDHFKRYEALFEQHRAAMDLERSRS